MYSLLYWIPSDDFPAVTDAFAKMDVTLAPSKLTPCETLRVSADKAIYASPAVFSRMCIRQGSWYRESDRNGKYLLLTPARLPDEFDQSLIHRSGSKAAKIERHVLIAAVFDASLQRIVDFHCTGKLIRQ